uniref:Zinc-hook domain-containing protein n=1 Tax=Fagus sylvatica TaxID=28930 RepID=A0A2N9FA08_FAGSY
MLVSIPVECSDTERYHSCLIFQITSRKRFIESKLQSLDRQSLSIDSYLKVLETTKEKRDVQKSKYNIADGMRQMFDPFERVARAHHVCPCCECPFSAEEEDEFVKKQRVKAASSAEHMKVLAVDSSNADSHFQQLDKLRMVYEEYVKIGKETIPNAEKDLHELTQELDLKSQALDDVIIDSGLKINLGKSELVLVANVLNVIELANLVGCKVSRLPMKYLCLPLGSTFKAKAIWDSVVDTPLDRAVLGKLQCWRGIWKSKVPPRVAFFTWTAVLGKLPTIDNLRKRNMVIVNRCCLCKTAAESIDHLFLHCNLAKDLWDSVLSSFGVSWVMPCQVIGVLAQVKADKDSIEALVQPVETADRFFQEIQTWQKQVDDLEEKLDVGGQGVKTMEEIQSELNTLQSTNHIDYVAFASTFILQIM